MIILLYKSTFYIHVSRNVAHLAPIAFELKNFIPSALGVTVGGINDEPYLPFVAIGCDVLFL